MQRAEAAAAIDLSSYLFLRIIAAAELPGGALCLARAQRCCGVHLPVPLVWRLLGLCLAD